MIQIGEAVNNGKNITRNEILKFAQNSSSDGLKFNNIADNQLQNQDIYAPFKNVKVESEPN